MKIDKSWFYVLEGMEKDITIPDGVKICLFDESLISRKFTIGNNTILHYFSRFISWGSVEKHFYIAGVKSDVMVRSFQYVQGTSFTGSFIWELANSESKLDMSIMSIAGEQWEIDIDGVVKINANISKVEWYLKQQNIFLWNSWKIRGIPTLIVHSNDVKASHGCNIEKISDDKLFYLRSRGLDRSLATQVMIEGYLRNAFWYLEHVDGAFYDATIKDTLKIIV